MFKSRVGSVCGSRTEKIQKHKNIFNSLVVAVILKDKRNVASNS